jgi:hypothetical protein
MSVTNLVIVEMKKDRAGHGAAQQFVGTPDAAEVESTLDPLDDVPVETIPQRLDC